MCKGKFCQKGFAQILLFERLGEVRVGDPEAASFHLQALCLVNGPWRNCELSRSQ